MAPRIHPVILSGGAGSRLWPLSRESYPKQLLPLTGDHSLLQETALRAADPERFHPLIVIANAEHRFVIAEQLREIGARDPRIVLEPTARNTAAAVAVAALVASAQEAEALILVMPADHAIPDTQAFLAAIEGGLPAALQGQLVLFGIRPDSPATGYGYIRAGAPLAGRAHRVDAFVEKPDLATAEAYLDSGDYSWNSGIFLLPAATLLAELHAHEPAVLSAARIALDAASQDLDFCRLDAAGFAASPSISIDYAVMERTARAAVVPSDFLWSDVGAWGALWGLAERDPSGNVAIGDVVAERTAGSYLRSEGPLVAVVGVEDLIVVATPDAVLVAGRHADQEVKALVDRLKATNHTTAVQTRRVYRPWGWYEALHVGERFQVKRITVNPGGKLSLQQHAQRAEHWVVVNGTAEVELDGERRRLGENESIYVPLGAKHRLSNPSEVPLNLIEVQSGAYLGEDDIVRFEDAYART
ncbi:mannose-1-phosphate guanylyltransferase/mannose-6-phosphate isomerase [Phenylobacterium sp.]|jgi:mannose-1-phosphate guanylyltransferase/mannose-1-phosphate guanylyltransferase/mannose-6-phosphate isomerase|uniref:mannose-1-phosphate guanylyltransferase/mannose-6-phosphate isomerase n=1 Tax=Phenylobacterium sp. TaxID=1871053 RepID=UPI002F91F331